MLVLVVLLLPQFLQLKGILTRELAPLLVLPSLARQLLMMCMMSTKEIQEQSPWTWMLRRCSIRMTTKAPPS